MCGGRKHKHGSDGSQYTMHEGETTDGFCLRHAGRKRGHPGFIRLLVLFLVLGAVFTHMRHTEQRVEANSWRTPVEAPIAAPVEQSPFENKTVGRGETIDGDLVNYSGNVTVQGGGKVSGDLVLFSGNAVIEAGGVVEGDLTVWSGNVTVHGTVEGDIAAMSGNIFLEDGAVVEGNVSSFSGNIQRSGAVSIQGDVVSGISKGVPFWSSSSAALTDALDSIEVSDASTASEASDASSFEASSGSSRSNTSFFERVIFLIGRLIFAAVVTVAVSLLSVALFSIRPNSLTAALGRMRESLGGSFVLGAVTNFGLLIAMRALFAVGFCFAPIAVITLLGLVALVTLGYGVVGRLVGGRMLDALHRSGDGAERKPALEVAAGTFAMTGVIALLSAITASSWVFFIGVLLASAPGVGALILPWVDKVRNRKSQDLTSPGPRPVSPASGAFGSKYPMPASAEDATAAAKAVVKPYAPARPIQPAPFDSAPAAAQGSTPQAATGSVDLSAVDVTSAVASATVAEGEWVLEPPTSLQGGTSSAEALTLPEASAPAPAGTPGITVEDLVQAADADRAARDAVKAAETAARERAIDVSIGDDLTRITGLGKSSERKLKGAGILTYTQLAAVPVEMIATILGVPVEEVIEDEIVKQARNLTSHA